MEILISFQIIMINIILIYYDYLGLILIQINCILLVPTYVLCYDVLINKFLVNYLRFLHSINEMLCFITFIFYISNAVTFLGDSVIIRIYIIHNNETSWTCKTTFPKCSHVYDTVVYIRMFWITIPAISERAPFGKVGWRTYTIVNLS